MSQAPGRYMQWKQAKRLNYDEIRQDQNTHRYLPPECLIH